MKQSIVILDDVFDTTDSLSHLIDNKVEADDWYDLEAEHKYKDFCLSILQIAGDYFDLSNAVGYEFWGHNGTKPDWHYDKDEVLFEKDRTLSFPLCSTAYYLAISGMKGGELVVQQDTITPKPNRLVIFAPGKFHTVRPFAGKRVSLLINPWDHELCK